MRLSIFVCNASAKDLFNIDKKNQVGMYPNNMLTERMHTFDQELFEKCPDNVDLFGYYQCPKYFNHIEDEIRKDFSFPKELIDSAQEVIDTLGDEAISLHIRRTDYIANPNHPLQPLEYYTKALDKLPKDVSVVVFSDDFEWCDQQEEFSDDRFAISNNACLLYTSPSPRD